ncbi:hypothetical protein [Pyramidobacter piscolens]|uniref:hypothetical protein n=1 Tax=Pyramidobacter piscolens TaxID=638849 RepID=UPI002AB2A23B|nr:hypothetical protein [Pyramidobacter piscolens]
MLNYVDLLDLERKLGVGFEDKLVANPDAINERVYFSAEAVDRYIRFVDKVAAALKERVDELEDQVEEMESKQAARGLDD